MQHIMCLSGFINELVVLYYICFSQC